MKKVILFLLLAVLSLAVQAQDTYMILDGKVVNKPTFDSIRTALSNQVLTPNRLSVVKYSNREDRCLCVEFYSLRPEGINLHRDCQDNISVAYTSTTDILTVIKNSKLVEYYVFDPVTRMRVHPSPRYVNIFEINPANAAQGLKHWERYPDGTEFE